MFARALSFSSFFQPFAITLMLVVVSANFSIAQEKSRSDRNSEGGVEAYVDALLDRYDQDSSGDLDAEELTRMRRKPKDADKNEDGKISRDELLDRYLAGYRAQKKARDGNAVRSDRNSKRAIQSTGSALIDVMIIQFPDTEEVDGWVEELREKNRDEARQLVRKMASNSKDVSFDSLQLSTQLNQQTTLKIGSTEQRVTGVTVTRGGNVQRSIQSYDVGTIISMTATKTDDGYALSFELEKSQVGDSDIVIAEQDEAKVFGSEIRTLEIATTLVCKTGKTAVFTSSDAGVRWIVTVNAK